MDNRTDKEKLREGEREIQRLERQHEQHEEKKYKLVRATRAGIAVGLTSAILAVGALAIGLINKTKEATEPTAATLVSMQDNQDFQMLRYYTVESGDTLIGIADKVGISWKDLAKENNIEKSPYIINVGQTLRITYSIPQDELQYYIYEDRVNGRTVPEIAADCNTSSGVICELNPKTIKYDYSKNTYTIDGDKVIVVNPEMNPAKVAELKEGHHK